MAARKRSRSRYRHRKVGSAKALDPRSIRTVKSGRARVVVGCPKGKYSAKRKRCKVGTRAAAVLTPKQKNPTLVHQGLAVKPTFHLLDKVGRGIADLYGVNLDAARKVAQAIADARGMSVVVVPSAGSGYEAAKFARSITSAAPRMRNPGRAALSAAGRTFRKWHGFDPARITVISGRRTIPRTLVALGTIPEFVYESDKWTGRKETYVHKTSKPKPVLATGPDGRGLYVIGGRVKVTADGLVG